MNSVLRRYAVEALEPRRLLTAIDRDPTFGGGDGLIVADFFGGDDQALAVAVQPNGRILAAGTAYYEGDPNRFIPAGIYAAVARFNVDGSKDDGGQTDITPGDVFGNGGVRFIFIAASTLLSVRESFGTAEAVAVQSDGRIVVAGDVVLRDSNGQTTSQWFFARLNSDGSFDSSFGEFGRSLAAFRGNAALVDMELQRDNRIVAVGIDAADGQTPWAVARLTTSGAFDTTFSGGDGTSGYDLLTWDGLPGTPSGLTVDHLGRPVVAGTVYNADFSRADVATVRYGSDGRLDGTYSVDGKARARDDFVSRWTASDLVVRPGGQFVVAGAADSDGRQKPTAFSFTAAGQSLGGSSTFRLGLLTDVAVSVDNRVFGGGFVVDLTRGNTDDFFLTDYSILGQPEQASDFGASLHDPGADLVTAPDGKLVQGGYTKAGGGGDNFAIARYQGVPVSQFGAVTGQVFVDADGDGVRDPNETGQADVRVYSDVDNDGHFDPEGGTFAGFERSVLTDASGNYVLAGLPPGTHRIREVVPLTFTRTFPVGGNLHVVAVAANQTITGRNFGNRPPRQNSGFATIEGSVFDDLDGDGTRYLGDGVIGAEPDIHGRTVFLDLNRNSRFDVDDEPSQLTDEGGNYLFDNLAPGIYRVRTVVPDGWARTAPALGFYDVTLEQGQRAAGRSFGTRQADGGPPQVLAVFASGSAWNAAFLAGQGGGAGFPIRGGAEQLITLPWTGLDRISVRFIKHVIVAAEHLTVRGVNVAKYAVTGFAYDPGSFTATWSLSAPVGAEKVRIVLSDDVTDDPPGEAPSLQLDGEWSDGAGEFPSGNGTAGGNFAFRFDVLPGDVNRSGGVVNSIDLQETRLRQFTGPFAPGTPPNTYTAFHDVDGSAFINALDVQRVRTRQFSTLPDGNPAAAVERNSFRSFGRPPGTEEEETE